MYMYTAKNIEYLYLTNDMSNMHTANDSVYVEL